MTKAYEVLGVDPNADKAAINTAFRRAAKTCHPDLRPGDSAGERQLRRLIAARAVLVNPKRSKIYSNTSGRRRPILIASKGRWRVLVASTLATILVALLCGSQQLGLTLAAGPLKTRTLEQKNSAELDANSAWITAIRDLQELLKRPHDYSLSNR